MFLPKQWFIILFLAVVLGASAGWSWLAQTEVATAATPTPTPTTASAADLEIVRFIFKNHPPVLGSLTGDFLKTVESGQYRDFSIQEVDLTGDQTPEILVSGRADTLYLFVAILSRDPKDQLHELFFSDNIEGKYLAEVRARVEGQRVIADFLTSTGGTGYLETTWEQRWIECQPKACKRVWSAPLLVAERIVTWTATRRYAVTELEQPNATIVHLTTHRFGLKELPLSGGAPPGSARRVVGPDTLAIYRREEAGQAYQLESQTQLTPGQEIAREFDLQSEETQQLVYEALSQPFYQADGTFDNDGFLKMQAELWGLPAPHQPDDPTWGAAYRQADIAAHSGPPSQLGKWVAGVISALDTPQCRLTVLRHATGKFTHLDGRLDLPCTANFTRLAWIDLTSDGREELLLLTIPPDVDVAGQVERLYVYATTGNKLTELTTLDGVINGADGVGIRWEETAKGFQVEAGLPLLDPDANPTLNDIRLEREFQTYRWNEEDNSFKLVE